MDKAKYHTEFATIGKRLFDEYDARGRAILAATCVRNNLGLVLHNGRGIDATVGFFDEEGITVYDTEVHCSKESTWEFGTFPHEFAYFPARKEDMFGRSGDVIVDTPSYDIENTLYFYCNYTGSDSLFFNCKTIQQNAEFVQKWNNDYWYKICPTLGVPYKGRSFIG